MSKTNSEETKKDIQIISDLEIKSIGLDYAPKTDKPKRTKSYIFSDVTGQRDAVVIEAISIEEATELFQKGNA